MTRPGFTVLITGANTGIGKEAARQFAERAETTRVILACRNEGKAHAARAELEAATGRTVFDVLLVDVSDLSSVRGALAGLNAPIDALIMNAGGSGGPTPAALTPDGVTHIFASNVLGHVVLLEQLISENLLTDVAVLVGSEAARGIPKLRMRRPTFATSSVEEFASVIDGSWFTETDFNGTVAYGQVKYLGALWMAALARRHSALRLVTVSPGNTVGTEGTRDMPALQRFLAKQVLMRVAPALGIAHSLRTGAQRLVTAATDPSLLSGVFYASAAPTITGPVVDQSHIVPDLADHTIQDNADQAIHRYIS